MFWKKTPSSPITTEDEEWLLSAIEWFEQAFNIDLLSQPVYLPDDDFLGFNYTGSEEDMLLVVDLVAEKMGINGNRISVYLYDEFQPMEFTDEGVYSNYEDGSQLTDGQYQEVVEGIYEIGIERTLLKNLSKLIATVAHELAHVKLLGEGRIEENDEPLTDLTASLFGFVVALANNSINKMDSWLGNTHSGWTIGGGSGYLHYKLYGFLIACWLKRKNETDAEWLQHLDKEVLGEVRKSLKYFNFKE
jgi:hypothetical protein